MLKTLRTVLSIALFGVMSLSIFACGVNTAYWNVVRLPFDSSNVTKVYITYDKKGYANSEEIHDSFIISDREKLDNVYSLIDNLKYDPKKLNTFDQDQIAVMDIIIVYTKNSLVMEYYFSYYGTGNHIGSIVLNDQSIHDSLFSPYHLYDRLKD